MPQYEVSGYLRNSDAHVQTTAPFILSPDNSDVRESQSTAPIVLSPNDSDVRKPDPSGFRKIELKRRDEQAEGNNPESVVDQLTLAPPQFAQLVLDCTLETFNGSIVVSRSQDLP